MSVDAKFKKGVVCLAAALVLLSAAGCFTGEKYKKAKDEILEAAKARDEVVLPDAKLLKDPDILAKLDAAQKARSEKKALLAEKIAAAQKIVAKDKKLSEDLAALEKELGAKDADWDKKAKALRVRASVKTQGDTVGGVGLGYTWEDIRTVMGEPSYEKAGADFHEMDYDGIKFLDFHDDGAALPSGWKSSGPSSMEIYGTQITTDGGVKIGMSRDEVLAAYEGRYNLVADGEGYVILDYSPDGQESTMHRQVLVFRQDVLFRLRAAKD